MSQSPGNTNKKVPVNQKSKVPVNQQSKVQGVPRTKLISQKQTKINNKNDMKRNKPNTSSSSGSNKPKKTKPKRPTEKKKVKQLVDDESENNNTSNNPTDDDAVETSDDDDEENIDETGSEASEKEHKERTLFLDTKKGSVKPKKSSFKAVSRESNVSDDDSVDNGVKAVDIKKATGNESTTEVQLLEICSQLLGYRELSAQMKSRTSVKASKVVAKIGELGPLVSKLI